MRFNRVGRRRLKRASLAIRYHRVALTYYCTAFNAGRRSTARSYIKSLWEDAPAHDRGHLTCLRHRHQAAAVPLDAPGEFEFEQIPAHGRRRGTGEPHQVVDGDRIGRAHV